MSACASDCMRSNSAANLSSCSSDADPSSLQGSRCSASSITPSVRDQDKALPPHEFSSGASIFPSRALVSFVAPIISRPHLHRLLHAIHLLDLSLHSRCDHIPFQLSVHG